MHKKRIRVLYICLLVLGLIMLTGCNPISILNQRTDAEDTKEETKNAEESETKESKEEAKEVKEDKKDDDDIIIADSVDTASKFSFSVEEAIIGLSEYDETPIVVLAGLFTNNSDEVISFSWALQTTAMQDGYRLSEAYLSGERDFNYNNIKPGETMPVFIGWEIEDLENDITLQVNDLRHYAKEEIYAETFTIEELISNTESYEELEGIIDKPL